VETIVEKPKVQIVHQPPLELHECYRCHGKGRRKMKTHEIVECPKCKGTGKILDAVNALLRKYIRSEVKNYCKTTYKA
jgi:DnaJ-class molecular chaperone